jgi:diguanylate cyclase (GGDEF)-like protein
MPRMRSGLAGFPRASALAALISVVAATSSFAIDASKPIDRHMIDVWQNETGLPQNSVLAILQTRDGYLWLGTQEGLARFDGVRFTVFDRTNTPAFESNHIQALIEDRRGDVWIATYGGGLLRRSGDVFTRFSTTEGLPNNTIRALDLDRDGNLLVGTNGGLARYRDGKFTTILSTKNGLASDEVVSIFEDADRTLWIGTYGGGLHSWKDGKLTHYGVEQGLSNDKVWAVVRDGEGSLWIGTRDGLNRLRDGKFSAFRRKDGLPHDIIDCLFLDKSGALWIGTRGGLALWRNGTFESLTAKNGLPDGMVRAAYEDAEHNLWIGTYAGGLVRLKDRLIEMISADDGLSEDVTRAILQDRKGAMWIGTYGSGINRIENGQITTFDQTRGLVHDRAWAVAEDADGSVWIGTYGGGVSHLKNGAFTNYTKADGLVNDQVRCVYRHPSGDIWIGTNGGVSQFANGRFTNYTTREGLATDKVVSLQADRSGALWIGTTAGLSRLKDGQVTSLLTGDGLSHAMIYTIYVDANDVLWIGTAGGLTRLKNGRAFAYRVTDGLFNDSIYQVLEDDSGFLWMSSASGIFRVSKQELDDFASRKVQSVTSISFGKSDGMRSSECNGGFQPAGWKTRDGLMWFATIKGAAIVDPRQTHTNKRPPPVVIESLLIDDKPVARQTDLVLPAQSRKFEFQYAALTYVAPEKAKFKYKLDGFDADWVDAGARRVAYYTSIPPGTYTFSVMACNNDGVWSSSAPLSFELRPHSYQTWWFEFLTALAVIALIALLYMLRVRQLRVREDHLVRIVGERTREIKEEHAAAVRAAEQVEHLAYHDTLTGLPNRSLFMDRLLVTLAQARRDMAAPAVFFLDIDRFKGINDSLGHSVGDAVLREVGNRIRKHVREADSVARFGGDEFTILIPTLERAEDAARIAEKVLEHVREPIQIADRELCVTVSIGISVYPQDGEDAEALVMNADAAMYRAKDHGRDNYQMYAPSMNASAAERLALETMLRKAVRQNELLLLYQPLVDLSTGAIFGAEALLRWRHPERGVMSPSEFIELAEITGLIIPIGEWVLRTACAEATQWRNANGDPLTISVNLSARQFQQVNLADDVRFVLEDTGLDARLLDLEITEGSAMKNPENTIRTLQALKELGVCVAIDDFGIGYSSLNYLKRFPIDIIKLDQSFVRDLAFDAGDRAIASAVIALAHSFGLKVIAEGVENEEQLGILRQQGCDHMQGYLFSVPLPADEFRQLLVDRSVPRFLGVPRSSSE